MKLPLVLNITCCLPNGRASAHTLFPFIKNRGAGWLFFCPQVTLPASSLALHFFNTRWCPLSSVTALLSHLLLPFPALYNHQALCGLLNFTSAIARALYPCFSRPLLASPIHITTQIPAENSSATFCYAYFLISGYYLCIKEEVKHL